MKSNRNTHNHLKRTTMYTYTDTIVKHIIRQLNGLPKIEVYDILATLEALLLHQASPIVAAQFIRSHETHVIRKRGIVATQQLYYFLYDRCYYLNVYKYHSLLLPAICYKNELYFSHPTGEESYPLTKENIRTHLTHHAIQAALAAFLVKHKPTERHPITKRLLLLQLLDQIDPV